MIMEEPVSQKTVIPEEKYIVIPCGDCDRDTRHKILALTDTHWQDTEVNVDLWKEHQIVQCQGCFAISFSIESQFSEDMDFNPRTGEEYVPTKRKNYPNRITGRPMMQKAHLLPHGVYKIYEESHNALCADLKIMAGFGIRAIIEAVCKDNNMTGRNLQEKIDSLANEGLITQAGSVILHNLRFMGNAAAHEMKAHTLKELDTSFDVVEYLLKGVYILPKQAENLPTRSS